MRCDCCGAEMPDSASFCPVCGAQQGPWAAAAQQAGYQTPYSATPQSSGAYGYQQPNGQPGSYQPNQQPYAQQQAPNDSGSFGWAVLGFFFPIVGLVLYIVWRNEKPRCAKMAGGGALASVVLSVVSVALSCCAILASVGIA